MPIVFVFSRLALSFADRTNATKYRHVMWLVSMAMIISVVVVVVVVV